MKRTLFALLLLSLTLLNACSAATPQPATLAPAPVEPTATQAVTNTPWPTLKFIPTWTPRPSPTPRALTMADQRTFDLLKRLGRGVNLGNALEAPQEGEWGVTLKEEYFDLIANAGFNSVRVPIRWPAHALTEAPYTIEPAFFERVDWVVEQSLKRNLAVIINIHHFDEAINTEPGKHIDRFLGIWKQIAEHYKDQPETVYFELLNEPYDILGKTDEWNKMAAAGIKVVRETNPDRVIVVGPGEWNSIAMLDYLRLPEKDRSIIVTYHFYQPFQFTHQGAEWAEGSDAWMGTTWDGTDAEKAAIAKEFDAALMWSQQNARPIYMGEFGAYYKADMDSRERWTAFVAREAERRGFAWGYWEFCSGFGVYDPNKLEWNDPILRSLIPPQG